MLTLKPFTLRTHRDYKKYRSTIVTGDVISMQRTGIIWSFFSLFLGKDAPNHSGIAYVQDGVVWCAEMSWSGNHLVRLSTYTTQFGHNVGWLRIDQCPMNNKKKQVRSGAILSTLYSEIRYSGLQLIAAGFERMTGFVFKYRLNPDSQICSMFVINSLIKMGWEPESKLSIIDPQELMELVADANRSDSDRTLNKK